MDYTPQLVRGDIDEKLLSSSTLIGLNASFLCFFRTLLEGLFIQPEGISVSTSSICIVYTHTG